MPYQFTDLTNQQLQSAFSNARVVRENSVNGATRSWDFIFIKLEKPQPLAGLPDSKDDIVQTIFNGDGAIKDCYAKKFDKKNLFVEAGLRWVGSAQGDRVVYALGLSLKISFAHNKFDEKSFIACTTEILQQFNLITIKDGETLSEKLKNVFCSRATKQVAPEQKSVGLFAKPSRPLLKIDDAKQYVRDTVSLINPKYIRDNENEINPCFQMLEDRNKTLTLNQKIIWLFRNDGALVTGVKNAYWISFGENELAEAVNAGSHKHINWDDRFGHTSLVPAGVSPDRSAYYGGYICQRSNHLQVFTSSGRYYRDDLSDAAKKTLEAYLTLRFQSVFGEQNVIFCEAPYRDYYELSIFYADLSLPESTVKMRVYTKESAKKIFAELDQDARAAFLSALHSQDARTPAHQFFAGLTAKNKHQNTRNLVETIFEFASNQVRSAQPPI